VEDGAASPIAMASRNRPRTAGPQQIELLDSEAWMKHLHGWQSRWGSEVLKIFSGDPLRP